jgi:glyoxylase-like metal-dependent hydrolase (beta-lactamase superfamily II)/ferredoxin
VDLTARVGQDPGMASPDRRLPANVAGDVFVDDTCIDCDACRWIAPETFHRHGTHSVVHTQPTGPTATRRALAALVSCPTASIGTEAKHDLAPVVASFPEPIVDGIHHNGFHHEGTFGATTYLIVRPEARGGNVLVDSPRFTKPLVRRIEELGGVRTMFLTHRDDVGDHERFREHFGCERVLHAGDATGRLDGVERVVEGTAPVALDDELLVIPTPGHTRGSACLLDRGTYLFSGDHVAWSWRLEHVHAFRTACWYDWDVQIEAMERLAEHDFEWILPGHGRRCTFDRARMRDEMRRCVEWMRAEA